MLQLLYSWLHYCSRDCDNFTLGDCKRVKIECKYECARKLFIICSKCRQLNQAVTIVAYFMQSLPSSARKRNIFLHHVKSVLYQWVQICGAFQFLRQIKTYFTSLMKMNGANVKFMIIGNIMEFILKFINILLMNESFMNVTTFYLYAHAIEINSIRCSMAIFRWAIEAKAYYKNY